MKIGLSFLGPSDYKTAVYVWRPSSTDRTCEYETDLFPETLNIFFTLTKLLIFVTKDARKHENCHRLQLKLGDLVEFVDIPDGKNENELWQIFDIVTEKVPSNASVIIDITHAFRYLPLVIFNLASYLRRIKNVEVSNIVYGNWEVRDTSFQPPRAPVFDLTSTLELQNWLYGIDAFQRRGEAYELATSLAKTQGRFYKKEISVNSINRPQKLKDTGHCLQDFSEAIRLLRPLKAFEAAKELFSFLEDVHNESILWAKPFAEILRELENEIKLLKLNKPLELNKNHLKAEHHLILYYLEKDLIVQAVLLAREFLVSYLAWQTGIQDQWRDRDIRCKIERKLNQATRWKQGKEDSTVPDWYDKIAGADILIKLWGDVVELRNSIAHCEMNQAETCNPSTIRNNIRNITSQIQSLL